MLSLYKILYRLVLRFYSMMHLYWCFIVVNLLILQYLVFTCCDIMLLVLYIQYIIQHTLFVRNKVIIMHPRHIDN